MRSNKRNTRKRSFKKKQKSIKRGGALTTPMSPEEIDGANDGLINDAKGILNLQSLGSRSKKFKIISEFIELFYNDIKELKKEAKLNRKLIDINVY